MRLNQTKKASQQKKQSAKGKDNLLSEIKYMQIMSLIRG